MSSGVCSATNLQLYLPYLNLMVALWDEINKSGKVGKKDEDKIYKEVNQIFKDNAKTDEDFPFDLKSTLFSVKLLWLDSQYELSRPLAMLRWAYQNYTTQHELIEITGKNGCIYTMGLYVDLVNKKPEIIMNDHSFNICTLKNKECANGILKNGIYEKINKDTKKVIYQIKDKQHCNVLCKSMVNMREDDKNKYTPISHTRQKHLGSYMEGVLNIDHIKILQYLIYNTTAVFQLLLTGFESDHTDEEVDTEIIKKYGLKSTEYSVSTGFIMLIFKTKEDINEANLKLNSLQVPVLSAKKLVANYYGIPILKTSLDQANYSAIGHLKFKNEHIKKALSWMGLGKVCSKENEFNCRTFAEDFYTDSAKMLSTLQSILPEPVLHPGLTDYVDTLLPFSTTPERKPSPSASAKRKSKSLTPSARKSNSLTPSSASAKRKSKSLTPASAKRKSKSLTPRRSKSLSR
jgi:hypothetical protein